MTAEEYKLQAESLREQLLVTARRLLGDTGEAEDIVQDTMVKLWLMRERLNPPILGIASIVTRNLCIDCIRKKRPMFDITQLPETEDFSDNGEQIEQMLQIIDTLPSTQRTILRMRHLEGMEMKEIAMVLGSTEVAVRKTLSRARMAVRRKLIAWLAAACLVIGISMAAVYWLKLERQDECVAYVYGKKYTDEETVIKEMRHTMGQVMEDNPQDDIERQLNELFNE